MTDRGRLTLPDLAHFLFAVACLGALAPVFFASLEHNSSLMGTGELYLWQMVVPVAVLVLFGLIWYKGAGGAM